MQQDVCDELGLRKFPRVEAAMSGVGAGWTSRVLYGARIRLLHQLVPMLVDCRDDVYENILGRDVLNLFSITFDGKRQQITITD